MLNAYQTLKWCSSKFLELAVKVAILNLLRSFLSGQFHVGTGILCAGEGSDENIYSIDESDVQG